MQVFGGLGFKFKALGLGFGFWVLGFGFWVWGWGLGFRVYRVWGSGFRVCLCVCVCVRNWLSCVGKLCRTGGQACELRLRLLGPWVLHC